MAAAVVAGAAAAAVQAGGGGGGGQDEVAVAVGSKDEAPPTTAATTTSAPAPDPLCVAHQVRADAIAALGPVDGPADREAFVLAELAFYADVAGFEPESDATAFRALADYFDALRVFFEARGWQQAGLTDLAAMPRPPTGDAATRTAELLAERCGVATPVDTPVGVTP